MVQQVTSVGNLRPLKFGFSPTGEGQWKTLLRSPSDTKELGVAIGHELHGGEVITLIGELGAGKTCLVRGVANGVGLSTEEVTSPTFTVIQEYDSQPPIAHVDLYRLEHSAEIEDIGLSAYFDTGHVVIIEWADRMAPTQIPEDRLALHLTHGGRHSRHCTLQAFGTRSQALLKILIGPGS
jgi:tRNA threonylcarbamoyladenosine biosynthesis protein TsaE